MVLHDDQRGSPAAGYKSGGGAGEVVGERHGVGAVLEDVASGRFGVEGSPSAVECPVTDEVNYGRRLRGGL
jgi:hypothetical protein